MKIAIDLLPFDSKLAGTGVYIKNLLKYFGKLAPEHEFHLFIRNIAIENFQYAFPNYFIHSYNIENTFNRIFFEQTLFINKLNSIGTERLFIPSVVKPIFYNKNTTITIHDMIPYKLDCKYGFIRKNYIKMMTCLSAKTADKIITISNSSLKDIQDIYNVDNNKLSTIYNGLDKDKILDTDVPNNVIIKNMNIFSSYILYVGTIEPGKNILNTIKAFKNVIKKLNDNGLKDIQLVLVGKKTEYYNELSQYVNKNDLSNYVIFTGFVSDEDLAILYKNALLFIYVSFYEGFGLPVLEAMGNEIPVITSNVSSLPEVVGENGCIVSPYDIEEISDKCYFLLTNINARQNIIKEQNRQLKKFDWEICAKETLELILK